MSEFDARLQELELQFMEQGRVIEDLSTVVAAQQKELQALTKLVAYLRDKVVATPTLEDAAADDKPPHY